MGVSGDLACVASWRSIQVKPRDMPSPRFVRLDRRFVDLDPHTSTEHPEDPSAIPYTPRSEGYSWSDLLELRCVVVLAEAGSGKTTEFEDQATRRAPRPAFTVTVTDLSTEGIEALRRVAGFDSWLGGGTEPARLFLDSVDTALLERQTLARALSKLRAGLGAKWEACHVLISCRGSDWRPDTDLRTLEDYFPPVAGSGDEDGSARRERAYRVVRMLPLALDQASILASDRLGVPADEFLAAIADAQAEFFLTRPLDVLMLADIWREHRQIPALHALLPMVVEKKLRETNDERPPRDVAPNELLESARALAAAQLFCRASHIQVSGALQAPGHGSDLDPTQVLPHLSTPTVAEILTRALFDVATYGRARFHHRSVQEYLAAEWLLGLIERGCALDDVLDLLFRDVYGTRVAIPSRAPVLAWLATRNERVGEEAIRHASEVLLQWADPSALPIEWRRRALRKFVERPAGRFERRRDEATLRRFAHADLAPDISGYLAGPLATDAAIALLDMVRAGRLATCADVALLLALGPSADVEVRIVATQAVAATGTRAHADALVAHVVDTPGLDSSLVADVCQELFPDRMGVEQLVQVLQRACPQPADEATGIGWYVARRVREAASPDQAVEVVIGVLSIIRERGADAEWLLGCAFDLGADLLTRAPHLVSEQLLADLYKLSSDDRDRAMRSRDFREVITQRADVRRRLFWHVAQAIRAQQEGPFNWFKVRSAYSQAVHPSVDDLGWLQEDASVRADPIDRVIALDAAMVAARLGWDGEVEGARSEIRLLAAKEGALQRHFERELDRRTSMIEEPWQRQRRRWEAARERTRAKRRAADAAYIRARLDALRSGDSWSVLKHLGDLMRKSGAHNRWGVADAQVIVEAYDEEIAAAAEEGFATWWKRFTPLLPHERTQRNSVAAGVPCGLSGLLILSRRPGGLRQLSPDEARLAARYACTELNGFPDWFADLAEAHLEPVAEVLYEAVAGEYRAVPADGAVLHDVMANLSRAPRVLRISVAPLLVELLAERPGHPAVVGQALGALADLPEVASKLEVRARTMLERDDSPESVVTWWPTWFGLAPADAFAFLEAWEDRVTTPHMQEALLAALASMTSVELEAEHLARVVRLLVKRVPHAADVEHRGAYSPTARDNAERVRDRMMERLAAQAGPVAHRALVELAAASSGAVAQWFLHKARLRAQADSEPDPWREEDVARFGASFQRVPQTDAELFEVALARLRNVRRDLEGGDFSVKAAYWEKLERELQIWLAGELDLRKVGCYSVERESVVLDENRTDIRLRAGPDARVTLELKRVQDYSITNLLGALETQLVGQYMRDHRSAHGVLVLCMNGNAEKRWEAPGGGWWGLEDVVAHLGERALTIAATNASVHGLRVISIDFRKSTRTTGQTHTIPVQGL